MPVGDLRVVGSAAGPSFLAPDKPVGALISKVIDGRIYFSVNTKKGGLFLAITKGISSST